jgi:hypothetical protein
LLESVLPFRLHELAENLAPRLAFMSSGVGVVRRRKLLDRLLNGHVDRPSCRDRAEREED